jgi:formate-dependent nitrite reductase membrane component NrfD
MNIPQPGSVIATGLALLAFVIAFYVLLARERKIPYITNFVFPPAALLILATLFAFVGQLLQPVSSQPGQPAVSMFSKFRTVSSATAISLAMLCLAIGIVVTLSHIWRLHNRQVHFRDDHRLKILGLCVG